MRSRIARRRLATSVAVVLVLGGLGVLACSSDEEKFASHLSRAEEYEADGQRKEALLELRSALQLDPKNAEVNYRIAKLMQREGRAADAAFFYRETTRLDPSRSDAALAEAKILLFDDTDRAETLVEGVIEREPKNADAYIRRSEIALARNNSEAALEAALTATELAPDRGLPHMQLGIVQLARIRELTGRRQTVPESVYEQAEKAFQKAASEFRTGTNAYVQLGRLYTIWPDHLAAAEGAYRKAIEVADGPRRRARAAVAVASHARAVQNEELLRFALETTVEAVPEHLDGWSQLAAVEEQREPGAGEAVYQRLLAERPDDAEAHFRYATYLTGKGRVDDAIQHLQSQVDAGNEPAVALDEMIVIRLRNDDLAGAREPLERLRKDYPDHPRTQLAKARIAISERRPAEAVELLNRYLGSQETSEGQRLLALAELMQRNFPSATAAVDRALQLEPGSKVDLLRLKVSIHAAAGDQPLVLQTLNRLRAERAELTPAERLANVRALYALNRRPAARAMLEELLATENPPIGAYLEFASQELRSEPKRSVAYLERVLERQPRNPTAMRMLAQIDLGSNQPERALARIDAAAEGGTLSPALMLLRAQILASRGELDRAEEDARRAFAASPELPGALELLANVYVAQGRVEEAIASFEEADQVGALPPSGQQLLARLKVTAGRPDEAKALYEKVIATRSDMPGAKNDLAFLLADEGTDLERALTLAQEAQQAEPESSDVADTLGYVYLKKGLNEPALQQFRYAIELAQRSQDDPEMERPEYHYHVGLTLRALDRNDEAASAFERALELDAKFANADDARRQLEAARASGGSGPG